MRPAPLVLAAVLAAGAATAQTGNPGGPINDNLGAADYGVCRGLDVKCFHDWARPKSEKYRVLLFTRTGGPRHQNLGPALPPGLNRRWPTPTSCTRAWRRSRRRTAGPSTTPRTWRS